MIDRKVFFDSVRLSLFSRGGLSAGQVDGMNRILDEWIRSQIPDLRFLAYMLSSTFHESAQTMQPIRELGSEEYLRSKKYYPWVGEGLVQVTWEANARKFGATRPGQLMTWPLCLKPLFDGMTRGMFTGKRLADYFNATTDDPINARRIINGIDRANLVAMYHGKFLAALKTSEKATTAPSPIPVPVPPKTPQPPQPIPQTESVGPLAAFINLIVLIIQALFKRNPK